MTDNVALPHLSSCAACQIGAKLACRIHLRRLCCFHLHSFADACFPFNPSRTLFYQLVGFFKSSQLGNKIAQELGDRLTNLAASTDNAEVKMMLYRLSAYTTGGALPSWFKGSTDEWNALVAERITELLEKTSDKMLGIDDKVTELLKGLLEGDAAK
jgi:hypothetical protein